MVVKMKKVVFSLILSFLLVFNCFASVSTEYNSEDLTEPLEVSSESVKGIGEKLNINAKSAILIEANTGAVLYEQNSHERVAPASITKIMSLLLVTEALDSGKINLQTEVIAGEHACSMGGSQIWLKENEKMTVDELLKAVCVASANDAIVALAEKICGSEEVFVEEMNKKAEELNLTNTNFENCTGLDSENHYTSAYDVARMSLELIKHKIIKNYTTIWMDTLRNGKSELVNTNKLVKYYSGCTGLKTGTTSKAGSCLSATAERDNLSLIAVVMGSSTGKERFNAARSLLDYGFANYETVTVKVDKSLLKPVTVLKGFKKNVETYSTEQKTVLVKKAEKEGINYKVNLKQNVEAPVKKGQKLGECKIYLNETEISQIDIVAKSSVSKRTFKASFACLLKFAVS